MTEDGKRFQTTTHPTSPGYPPANLPSVMVDGFANFAPIGGMIRAYMYRTDPEMSGKQEFRNQVIAQICMPLPSFLSTFVFMEAAVKNFIKNGAYTQEELESYRKAFREAEGKNAD